VRSWFGDEEAERRRGRDEYEAERRERQGERRRGRDEYEGERRRGRDEYEGERRRGRDEYDAERGERQGESWRPGQSINELRASDLMTRNIATVHPNDRIGHAARLMRDWDCGGIPVVDRDDRLIGIVTDRDITTRLVANEADMHDTIVADCMTEGAFACHADDQVRECMRHMSRHRIRRVPIVNNRGKVIGIISQGDLARYAGNYPGQGGRRAMADVLSEVSEPRRASRR
jgi:CBS domain-containing protein